MLGRHRRLSGLVSEASATLAAGGLLLLGLRRPVSSCSCSPRPTRTSYHRDSTIPRSWRSPPHGSCSCPPDAGLRTACRPSRWIHDLLPYDPGTRIHRPSRTPRDEMSAFDRLRRGDRRCSRRVHVRFLPTARISCALPIFERPSMPSRAASRRRSGRPSPRRLSRSPSTPPLTSCGLRALAAECGACAAGDIRDRVLMLSLSQYPPWQPTITSAHPPIASRYSVDEAVSCSGTPPRPDSYRPRVARGATDDRPCPREDMGTGPLPAYDVQHAGRSAGACPEGYDGWAAAFSLGTHALFRIAVRQGAVLSSPTFQRVEASGPEPRMPEVRDKLSSRAREEQRSARARERLVAAWLRSLASQKHH